MGTVVKPEQEEGGGGGGADVSRCSTLTGREKPLLVYRGAA